MRRRDHKNHWSDSDVEAHWDSVADIYVSENEKVKKTHDQRFFESITNLDLKPGMRVLNISSRDAEANDYINRSCDDIEVVNAEISQGLMQVAASLRPHISQVKISTYSELPFKDNYFHRVLTLETLEHAADPVAFLSELNRIAVPGAKMVLSCPPATSEIPYRIYTLLFGGHGEGPHRFLRSAEVRTMLVKTKWKLLAHKGTLLIPVGPDQLQVWGERIIERFQGSFISELGIRQFFICEKSE